MTKRRVSGTSLAAGHVLRKKCYVSWLNHKVIGKKKIRRTGEIKESIGQITDVFTSSYTYIYLHHIHSVFIHPRIPALN